jgi:hypothetical protein
MGRFKGECAQFSKCASAKFSTNSHETDNSELFEWDSYKEVIKEKNAQKCLVAMSKKI